MLSIFTIFIVILDVFFLVFGNIVVMGPFGIVFYPLEREEQRLSRAVEMFRRVQRAWCQRPENLSIYENSIKALKKLLHKLI